MATAKLNWANKILGRELLEVPANKKLTFNEVNQLRDVINDHADAIDDADNAATALAERVTTAESDIDALETNLGAKANSADVTTLAGRVTTAESDIAARLRIADVVDSLTSDLTNKPLSAAQGKALKTLIDNINTLLSSDTTTLDTLQEVVDFIEQNKDDLDNLSISNIAGLSAALAAKLDAATFNAHRDNESNPHNTTKAQVGLGNVDNTSDTDKPVSTAQATAIDAKLAKSAGITAIEKITQAAYDALTPNSTTLYIIV